MSLPKSRSQFHPAFCSASSKFNVSSFSRRSSFELKLQACRTRASSLACLQQVAPSVEVGGSSFRRYGLRAKWHGSSKRPGISSSRLGHSSKKRDRSSSELHRLSKKRDRSSSELHRLSKKRDRLSSELHHSSPRLDRLSKKRDRSSKKLGGLSSKVQRWRFGDDRALHAVN